MEDYKKWFWILIDVFVAIAAIAVVFFVMPTLEQLGNSYVPARTITVSAQGTATVSPDMAEIQFSVVSQGKNPDALSSDNNSKMSAVLEFVSSQAIASSDIATTGYDLEPNYSYDKNIQRDYITGYTLTQTVDLKIRDLTKVATVIGGLTPLGVNQIGGVNFTFQDPSKFVAIARADALQKAQMQAAQLATQGDASLGKVLNIGEYSNVPLPFNRSVQAYSMGAGMSAPSVPTIAPGTQDVTDQITVTYELR